MATQIDILGELIYLFSFALTSCSSLIYFGPALLSSFFFHLTLDA